MITVSDAIRRAREAVGLRLELLAEVIGIPVEALGAYESGAHDVPGDVLWRLSETLGVPLEDIESPEALERHLDVMSVRFRASQAALPDRARLAVARAASAAHEYVELEAIAERPSRYRDLIDRFPRPSPPPRRETWKSGRDLAVAVRERFGLNGPVASMLSFTERQLGVLVIWQKLPAEFAGYAFCDEIHGPAIVLNVNGRNQNELVGRFTVAHEVSHVLFDRDDLTALSRFDAYEDLYAYRDGNQEPVEIRANAFAIHFLAPARLFVDAWGAARGDIRHLMTRFGISFEAVRQHLDNYRLLPIDERVSGIATSADDEWKNAERSELWYPAFDDILIERRHSVAKLAFELWASGRITTSRLRQALGVGLPHQQLAELAPLYLDTIAA